jgi:hypothetical protein
MRRNHQRFLLAVVILIAVAFRLWGIGYDLPNIYHPDEPVAIAIIQTMFKTGDLNPHFFHWPSLFFYLNLLSYIPYYLVGKLLGAFHNPNDILAPVQVIMGTTRTQMPTAVLMGRMLTVCFGVASVLVVYLIGRQLSSKAWPGLLAALMLALLPTSVANSRSITPDTFATFFVLASIYGSLLVYHQGKTRHYLLAGICIGLAASSKYNTVLVALPLLLAHLARPGSRGLKEPRLYLAAAGSALAFLCTTPFAVLDLKTFVDGLLFDSRHYATGHAGMEGDSLRWYVSYLWTVLGPICLLALVGIAYGLVRSRQVAILSVFPVVYFAWVSRFVVRNDRTILPIMPLLCLLAAWAAVQLFERAGRLRRAGIRLASAIGLSALVITSLGWLTATTVQASAQMTTINSRETARVWIENNLPAGAKIAVESYSPFVDPSRFAVQGFLRIIDQTPQWYADQSFEYLVFSQSMFGRFYYEPTRYADEVAQYDSFFDRFQLVRVFTDGGYEVRIYRVTDG